MFSVDFDVDEVLNGLTSLEAGIRVQVNRHATSVAELIATEHEKNITQDYNAEEPCKIGEGAGPGEFPFMWTETARNAVAWNVIADSRGFVSSAVGYTAARNPCHGKTPGEYMEEILVQQWGYLGIEETYNQLESRIRAMADDVVPQIVNRSG